jgi:hypothetical protein
MVEATEANTEIKSDVITDAKIYDPQQENLDSLSLEFTVRNPVNNSGTVLYTVTGRDKEGLFEGQRRYNEFFLLHTALVARYPCIPIPAIPPKQNFGNTDLVFI